MTTTHDELWRAYAEHVVARRWKLPTYTVPACLECNDLAKGDFFSTFDDKRQFIHDKLERKHQKLLKMPEWDEYEIEELSGNLKQDVLAHLSARETLLQRLKWNPFFILGENEARDAKLEKDITFTVSGVATPPWAI